MCPGNTSWRSLRICLTVSLLLVSDVIDVLVSPSSLITELCDVSSCRSDGEFVEPQSFSFFKKRAHCCTDTREEMRYEGSTVMTPPLSRRRMTPPTPVQNSYTSFVRDHERYEEEGTGWNARERTIIARTKTVSGRSFSVKVRVEELEGFLGPEDVDVDVRRILKEARSFLRLFSSDDLRLLVAEWSRWDKYKRALWRQDSSASARGGWWREDQEQTKGAPRS